MGIVRVLLKPLAQSSLATVENPRMTMLVVGRQRRGVGTRSVLSIRPSTQQHSTTFVHFHLTTGSNRYTTRMGNRVSLEDEMINLRIVSKQMQRSAKKCEKNEKAALEKLKKVRTIIQKLLMMNIPAVGCSS